jgi:phospholipid-binding lipoprotein MlaA
VYVLIGVIFVLFLTGCSTKTTQGEISKSNPQVNETSDPFLDEFNDEFSVSSEKEQQSDPFEGYNRIMTSFNDGVYTYVLIPVAKGYRAITHEKVRESIGNFFSNLFIPVSIVNNILQGEFKDSGTELGRFLINTTLGFAGLFDPAKESFGIESKKEDFGQTLGVWGIGSGPHIVLPFLGPSNLRDFVGIFPDSYINPVDYYDDRSYNLLNNTKESTGAKLFDRVNYTAINDGQYEAMKEDAIDLYPYFKNAYEQYRTNQIKE